MSNAKHTPGPWQLRERDGSSSYALTDATGEHVQYLARSRYCDGRRDEEGEANCQLIAAAPELLAALESVINGLQCHADWDCVERARAAIAKAVASD